MAGDTALSSSASFRSAIPTMPANGYELSVVAIRASPSRVSSPDVEELNGSRSLWLPVETATRRSPPVTVAGQPRIHTGVPPRCYLSTA